MSEYTWTLSRFCDAYEGEHETRTQSDLREAYEQATADREAAEAVFYAAEPGSEAETEAETLMDAAHDAEAEAKKEYEQSIEAPDWD